MLHAGRDFSLFWDESDVCFVVGRLSTFGFRISFTATMLKQLGSLSEKNCIRASSTNSGVVIIDNTNKGFYLEYFGEQPKMHTLNLERITDVSSFSSHFLLLSDDQVYGWGTKTDGQLGNIEMEQKRTKIYKFSSNLHHIPTPTPIIQVAAGDSHSVLLDVEHQVWTLGANKFGELGIGSVTYSCDPVKSLFPECRSIAAGNKITYSVAMDYAVWTCGAKDPRKLLDETDIHMTPIQIQGLSNIKTISCALRYALALDDQGHVFKIKTSEIHSQIPDLPEIIAVSSGNTHSLFADVNGQVWVLGK
jgi:alpha-tubulin suppressor-like RCC1 family protein